jgi:hypothetical protein
MEDLMHMHLSSRTTLDEPKAEPLVQRTLEGNGCARDDLWLLLDPVIEAIAGRRRVTGRLAAREDERRNIVLLTLYLWPEGHDDAEIAAELHLEGRGAAARLLRAGVERLRYRFAGEGCPGEPGKNIRQGVLPKSPETVSWRG